MLWQDNIIVIKPLWDCVKSIRCGVYCCCLCVQMNLINKFSFMITNVFHFNSISSHFKWNVAFNSITKEQTERIYRFFFSVIFQMIWINKMNQNSVNNVPTKKCIATDPELAICITHKHFEPTEITLGLNLQYTELVGMMPWQPPRLARVFIACHRMWQTETATYPD